MLALVRARISYCRRANSVCLIRVAYATLFLFVSFEPRHSMLHQEIPSSMVCKACAPVAISSLAEG